MLETFAPGCVEELSQVVSPWQLTLRQLSGSELRAVVCCTPVNGILVTNERWQAHVHGLGGTAADYFTIAGNNAGFPVFWKGQAVVKDTLACAPGNTECEFHTPMGADHWVMLIPQKKLEDYMLIEAAWMLCPESHLLRGNQRQVRRMHALAKHLLAIPPLTVGSTDVLASADQFEATILACVADLLGDNAGKSCATAASGRYAAYRAAIRYADENHYTVSSSDLAAAAGVSVRVLQLAFRENLGIPPHRYLRLGLLSELRADLRAASSADAGVTQRMEQHGLHEHGRVAGEYKLLFGELPSMTLARECRDTIPCFLDILPGRTTRGGALQVPGLDQGQSAT